MRRRLVWCAMYRYAIVVHNEFARLASRSNRVVADIGDGCEANVCMEPATKRHDRAIFGCDGSDLHKWRVGCR